MTKISITIDEKDLQSLVIQHLRERLGDIPLTPNDVKIEVKTTQNYRAEWERGQFRVSIEKTLE